MKAFGKSEEDAVILSIPKSCAGWPWIGVFVWPTNGAFQAAGPDGWSNATGSTGKLWHGVGMPILEPSFNHTIAKRWMPPT